MTTQSISLAAISDFPLKKLSMEIMRLLKFAPKFGDAVAELVAEESTRRVQGRDSLVTCIPVAAADERKAACNWACHVRQKFEQWGREAPEFAAEFIAAAEFVKQVEMANRD